MNLRGQAMLEIKTVLCPTDFSPVSDRGILLALQICSSFGSRLVLQNNLETLPRLMAEGLPSLPESFLRLDEDRYQQADQLLQTRLRNVPRSISAEARITKGETRTRILSLAQELSADLIVMGTHGRIGLGHIRIGSVVESVVGRSPCPVLTLRDSGQYMLFTSLLGKKKNGDLPVLVPVDFSPHSLETLEYAFRLADVLPITINLFHVIDPITSNDTERTQYCDFSEHRRSLIYSARQRLSSLIPGNLSRATRVHVSLGSAEEEIFRYADWLHARLIIMGIHQKRMLEEFFFGATCKEVLRTSPCPVWVVPRIVSAGIHAERNEAEMVAG